MFPPVPQTGRSSGAGPVGTATPQTPRIIAGPDGREFELPASATKEQVIQFFEDIYGKGDVKDAGSVKDLLIGAVKGMGDTFTGLGELVHKIPGVSGLVDALYGTPGLSEHAFPEQRKLNQPTNTMQAIGKTGEQIAEFFIPTSAASRGAKIATEATKSGLLTTAQTGSPTEGAINAGLTAAIPPVAKAVSGMLSRGAEESTIRALGPPGGRGPTGAARLKDAEQVAPTLMARVGDGRAFSPMTQRAARESAKSELAQAGSKMKLMMRVEGGLAGDKTPILTKIADERAKLRVSKAGGGTMLPAERETVDQLWATLEQEVKDVEPTVKGLHDLKQAWNEAVNWDDPVKEGANKIYETGGNLIRAQLKNDGPAVARADKVFSLASKLNELVNAPNVRRPGSGITGALAPHAAKAGGAVIGGAEGYREGGITGALAGAASGAALVSLLQSPGFRFISANMKQMLANALDKGDSARIATLVSSLTAQAQRYGKGKQ